MKAWTIKHKGKTWLGNMIFTNKYVDDKGDTLFYTGIIFFRKKDAKKYLKLNNCEHLEIVSIEIDNVNEDMRKKNKN